MSMGTEAKPTEAKPWKLARALRSAERRLEALQTALEAERAKVAQLVETGAAYLAEFGSNPLCADANCVACADRLRVSRAFRADLAAAGAK